MRAGLLRQRVIIEQPITVQDSYGQETITWVTYAEVWAAVEPLTGGERYSQADAQLLAEVDTRVRIRYRSGVTHKMRVNWENENRIFQIKAVINLETRDRQIHLLCQEHPDG